MSLLTGCQGRFEPSRLLKMHFAEQRREDAQARWDNVRGGVRLQVARQHLEAGRLDEAEKHLMQARSLAPRDPRVFMLLARVKLEQGKLAEARQAISAAQALPAGDAEVEYVAGLICERYGEMDRALVCYERAAEKAPNAPEYVLALAETLVALDRPMNALELIENRLNDFDSCIPMRMLASRLGRWLGLRNPAARHAREALRMGGEDPRLAEEAGLILGWAGHHAEAIEALEPLLSGPSPSSDAAVATYSTGVEAHSAGPSRRSPPPDSILPSPSLRLTLATAYLNVNQPEEAMRVLEPVLVRSGPDGTQDMGGRFASPLFAGLSAPCLYARSALAAGRPDLAAEALAEAHRRYAATAESLQLAAYAAMQRGALDDAATLTEQAVMLDPSAQVTYWLRGRIAEAAGDLDEARSAYARALALDPNSAPAKALLAALPVAGERGDGCRLGLDAEASTSTVREESRP